MQLKLEAIKILNQKKREQEQHAYLNLISLRMHDDFLNAEENLNSLRFEVAKQKAYSGDFGQLERDLRVAELDFLQVLKKHGKTLDSLNPKPLCAKCADNYQQIGALCDCVNHEMRRIMKQKDNKPTDAETLFPTTYPGFSKEDEAKNLAAASLVERWLDAFSDLKKTTLVLSGKTGVGKSRLASVVANRLNESNFAALFFNAQKLNDLFLKAYLAPLLDKENLLSPLYDSDLLVIDDLGAESFLQKVTAESLYAILSARGGKPLLVTTNLSPADVRERYGERIFSRLYDRTTALSVELVGSDFRLLK